MNTLIEQVKPETLAIIEAQAKRLGMSIDSYLRTILPATNSELALAGDAQTEDFEQDMAMFAETSEPTSNYDGNYSREDIYFDHN